MRQLAERQRGDRRRVDRSLPLLLFLVLALPSPLLAHCDTLDGPVVSAARVALEEGDVTPVLSWILAEHEAEVRSAFALAVVARRQGAEARELAERWFFETLVRLHRQGEGYPYAGLQPAGTPVDPIIAAADRALETGSGDELAHHLAAAVSEGVRARLRGALEAKAHADQSVEAGRHFVAAYVELTHYVEALDALASGHAGMHGGEAELSRRHVE